MEISTVPKSVDLIGIGDGNPLWIQALLDASAMTGAPIVDSEPHKLVILLGLLIGNPRVHPDAECFSEILSNLGPLLIGQFTQEECWFNCSGWSDGEIVSHVEAHNVIVDQCTQIGFDLMQGIKPPSEKMTFIE